MNSGIVFFSLLCRIHLHIGSLLGLCFTIYFYSIQLFPQINRKCSKDGGLKCIHSICIFFTCKGILSWKLGRSACLAKGDPMEISRYMLFMNTEHI